MLFACPGLSLRLGLCRFPATLPAIAVLLSNTKQVNLQFDIVPVLLYRPTIGPHVPRLKAFAKAHPEVRMLAGHMLLDWFEKEAMR
jgi:hypothetical protein